MVVAQSNDPPRSIADVVQEHGLNANMVARWRRAHERAQLATQPQPGQTFIPVRLPVPTQPSSSLVVECGCAAAIYSLIGTPKLNDIDPAAYLRFVLARIADHSTNRVDQLIPRAVADQLRNAN
jgi:transposase